MIQAESQIGGVKCDGSGHVVNHVPDAYCRHEPALLTYMKLKEVIYAKGPIRKIDMELKIGSLRQ